MHSDMGGECLGNSQGLYTEGKMKCSTPIEKQCNRECKRRVPKGIDGSY